MSVTRLRFTRGDRPGALVQLGQARSVFGRASSCELQLCGPQISRKHCVLTVRGGAAFLQDTSKGGTRVNGVAVRDCHLEVGDRILLGQYELEVLQIPDHDLSYQARGLLFGKLAIQLGMVEESAIECALATQAELRADGQHVGLGEILVERGALSAGRRDLLVEMQSAGALSEKEVHLGLLAVRTRIIDRAALADPARSAIREQLAAAQAQERPIVLWSRLCNRERGRDARLAGFDSECVEIVGERARCYVQLHGEGGRSQNLTIRWRRSGQRWHLACKEVDE